jgi:1,4-dihydroxy-2-naphthoate octaprenyltransferase
MAVQENLGMSLWQIWWLAIRPKALPAWISAVIVGSALARGHHAFQLSPVLAALCVALLPQIGSNVANDVYDFERGADAPGRQGALRVTQAGLLTPAKMKRGLWIIVGLAALVGLYLAFLRGWVIVVLGLVAIAAAIAYTGGPFPLAYFGVGDVFVFVFFGVVSVVGSYYVQTASVSPTALRMSIPVGLIVTDILVVNNLWDAGNDRIAGKRTLAVRIGESRTRAQYILLMLLAYALLPI